MPLYEYTCRTCGETFDQLRNLRDDDQDVECPKCGEKNAERKLSVAAFEGVTHAGSCRPSRRGGWSYG